MSDRKATANDVIVNLKHLQFAIIITWLKKTPYFQVQYSIMFSNHVLILVDILRVKRPPQDGKRLVCDVRHTF